MDELLEGGHRQLRTATRCTQGILRICVHATAAEDISSLTGKVTGATHFDWVPSRDRTHEADLGPLEQKFLIGPLTSLMMGRLRH